MRSQTARKTANQTDSDYNVNTDFDPICVYEEYGSTTFSEKVYKNDILVRNGTTVRHFQG